MFGLGMGEIVVILVVALLVLGPTQLPEAAKQIGKAIRQLRRHTRDLQDTIEKDEAIGGTVRELKSALRGDAFDEPWEKTTDRKVILPTRPPIPEAEKPVAQLDEKTTDTTAPAAPAPPAADAPREKTSENG